MNRPINAAPPVNATISVQPVSTPTAQGGSTSIPAALANLSPGTTVSGFVVNRDALNNPILRTALGDVQVQSDVFLRTGSEVVFRIDPSLATRARIVTVDGLTPQDYSAQNTRGLQQDTISQSLLPSRPIGANTALTAGRTEGNLPQLQAVVLQAAPVSANQIPANINPASLPPRFFAEAIPPALVRLAAGTPIQLTVVDVRLPPVPISLSTLPDVALPPQLLAPAPATSSGASGVSGNPLPVPPPTSSPPNAATTGAASIAAAPTASANPSVPTLPPGTAPATATPTNTPSNSIPLLPTVPAAALPPSAPNVPIAVATATIPIVNPPKVIPTLNAATAVPVSTPQLAAAPSVTGATALPLTASRTNPSQSLLTATVIGHEADGATIVQTRFATLKLYTPQPLPTGTTLSIQAQISPEPTIAPLSNSIADELTSFTALSRDWQNLSEALTLLQTSNPGVLREALQHLPNLGPRFTSAVIFLLSAIKGGNVRELLGTRATSRIASVAPELLAKLQQDVVQMQQFYVESPLNQWAGLTVPMLFGQELHQARLYIRRDDTAADASTSGSKGQRFIIEVDMTQLGDIQFDGFVRHAATDKTFDLMIRTARVLPLEMQEGIRTIFQTAAAVTGLKGQLTFQQGSQHFVRPLASAAPHLSGDGDSQAILA